MPHSILPKSTGDEWLMGNMKNIGQMIRNLCDWEGIIFYESDPCHVTFYVSQYSPKDKSLSLHGLPKREK